MQIPGQFSHSSAFKLNNISSTTNYSQVCVLPIIFDVVAGLLSIAKTVGIPSHKAAMNKHLQDVSYSTINQQPALFPTFSSCS